MSGRGRDAVKPAWLTTQPAAVGGLTSPQSPPEPRRPRDRSRDRTHPSSSSRPGPPSYREGDSYPPSRSAAASYDSYPPPVSSYPPASYPPMYGGMVPPPRMPMDPGQPPGRLIISNLPPTLGDNEVKHLIETVGAVKNFELIRDPQTKLSTGMGYFEFADASVTSKAMGILNGMEMGDRRIDVRLAAYHAPPQPGPAPIDISALAASLQAGIKASMGQQPPQQPYYPPHMPYGQVPPPQAPYGQQYAAAAMPPKPMYHQPMQPPPVPVHPAPPPVALQPSSVKPPSRVVVISNMVSTEELKDDADFREFKRELLDEATKFGKVLACHIPRPPELGTGRVWLQFDTLRDSQKALDGLHGRNFGERVVDCRFFDELKYAARDLA